MAVIQTALSNLIPTLRSTEPLNSGSSGLLSYLGIGITGSTTISSDNALTLSAYYNAVEIISNDIAIPVKAVYQKKDKSRKALPDHPVNYLIAKRPNQYMTSFMFHKMLVQYAIHKGNGYALIEKNKNTGETKALQLITEQVRVFKHNNKLFYKVFFKGGAQTYSSDEIIHIPGFSYDGITGISVIAHAAKSLGVALAAQTYSDQYYGSKGVGSGYVKSDKFLKSDAKTAIGNKFSAILSNGNPWSVPVLDEGMSFHPIQITAAEAEFLKASKHGVEEVARWLNIPPTKLKLLADASYANIENLEIVHNQDSILPWVMKLEQEYDFKLFTTAERKNKLFIKFNINTLMRADIKSQAEYFSKMIFDGVLTRNEVRAYLDLNPIDGLDEPLTPVNAQLMEQIDTKLELLKTQIKNVKA